MSDSKASTRAKNKYNEKSYDRATIVFKKGHKEKIQEYAAERGESFNGFVNRAIAEAIERDKKNSS